MAGPLLTFSAFRMGAYARLALIRGWALIQINTVSVVLFWPFFSAILYHSHLLSCRNCGEILDTKIL